MPKVATIPSTSPRRQCSGRVRFDRDHIGPVVITFPLAIDSHEDILFDEDDLVEPDPAELTSISSGAVASTSNSAAGASSVGVQAVSRKAVARSRTIGIDEVEVSPPSLIPGSLLIMNLGISLRKFEG
jgi:hypothetical protein